MSDEPETPTSPNEPEEQAEAPEPEQPPAEADDTPPPLRLPASPSEPDGAVEPPEPPPRATPWQRTDSALNFELLEDAPGCTAAVLGLPLRLWDTLAIVLMAIAADVCLYDNPGGTGAGVLFLVATIGLLSLAPKSDRAVSPMLLLSILLMTAASAWNFKAGLGILAFLAVTGLAIKIHRPDWRISEVGWVIPWTVVLAPVKFLGHLVRLLGFTGESEPGEPEPKRWRLIPLRIVLVPLCVVIVFVMIFRAANPVVERLTEDIFDWAAELLNELWELISPARIFTWVFWLMIFAALVRPVVKSYVADKLAKRSEKLKLPNGPAPDNANYATAAATLISVNLLFIAFHAIDWPYLYFDTKLPKGISYSEYAHRGCFWLTVGLLLSTAIIGVIFKKRLNFHPGAGLLRSLSYVWAALNGVLAIGALRRLQMYVDYNGMTRMRIVGIYGIVLVTVGLVLMVIKVRRSRNTAWLVRCDILALWVTLVLLALTPMDYISWTHNAGQAMKGNHRPLANLVAQKRRMSPESLPPLIQLLDYEPPGRALDDAVDAGTLRRGIAAILGQRLDGLRKTKPEAWTEWQGASDWALRALEAAEEKINKITPLENRANARKSLETRVKPWIHTPKRSRDREVTDYD